MTNGTILLIVMALGARETRMMIGINLSMTIIAWDCLTAQTCIDNSIVCSWLHMDFLIPLKENIRCLILKDLVLSVWKRVVTDKV